MQREHFSKELHQALQNLYEIPFLNRSPLVEFLRKKYTTQNRVAGQLLHDEILMAIEQLKPNDTVPASSPAWRVYKILKLRYVERLIVKEMEVSLILGGRQIRREILRAIDELTSYLWLRWDLEENDDLEGSLSEGENGAAESSLSRFIGNPQPHPLLEMCESVLSILQQSREVKFHQVRINIPATLPFVTVDRSLFRQVLLTSITKAVYGQPNNSVQITATSQPKIVLFTILAGPQEPEWESTDLQSMFKLLSRTGITVDRFLAKSNEFSLQLSLPTSQEHTILLIDDDENALHLFQRYLSGQPHRLISVRDSSSAIAIAEQERPAIILLDVLLPNIDGWEVLQSLKTNPMTRKIPVIICSALYRPEIASSLGAEGYLKKPIIQRDLLDTLHFWL